MTAGPLAGRRVLLTRRAPAVAARLTTLGATVLEAPAIAIAPPADPEPLARALARISVYDWIVFTSGNAVRAVAEGLAAQGAGLPASVRIASVGRATTSAVGEAFGGRAPDLAPASAFRGEGLVEAFTGVDLLERRVLLPVSDRAGDVVERGVGACGARVERVVAYRTIAAGAPGDLARLLAEGVDLVAFASPSAVEGFLAAAGEAGREAPAAVIGPTTAEAARAAGLAVVAEANPSTLDGLADAIVSALTPGSPRGLTP